MLKPDTARLAALITAGTLIGWLLDYPVLGLAVGVALYCYMVVGDSRLLYEWLRDHRDREPPVLHGYHEAAIREIQQLRHHHRQREEKLALFLKRFQDATSALPDAILILNLDDRIEWANRRCSEFLGIRWPQDASQRLSNLVRHPELLAYLKEQGQSGDIKGVTLPSPEDAGLRLEYRIIPYGDNLRLLVARDVTQIQQINQMRRDFIANASHELRTPLTVIAGYLESMDGDSESGAEELQPQIRQMRKQAARMQSLIEDLLMLSTLENPQGEQQAETVAVADMLAAIHKEAISLSGDSRHTIELDADPGLLVYGSYNELYSAFSNLVVNAVLYTPAGGIIRLRWYEDDTGAHMKVSDTGDGIAPEHIPRLTERFYRVDRGRSRESGGTGLGLAIVKHVMNRHGGRLHIESRPGKGSIFRCDMPPESIQHRAAADSSVVH